jgi:hypothetical protein
MVLRKALVNIPINMRGCFMLIDFWATLYFPFCMFLMYVVVARTAASVYEESHMQRGPKKYVHTVSCLMVFRFVDLK